MEEDRYAVRDRKGFDHVLERGAMHLTFSRQQRTDLAGRTDTLFPCHVPVEERLQTSSSIENSWMIMSLTPLCFAWNVASAL